MLSVSSYAHINNNIYPKKSTFNKGFGAIDVTDILTKGDNALAENKLQEALYYYKAANQRNPEEPKAYLKMAKVQFKLKDYSTAISNFETYLSAEPNDVNSIIALGETYRCSGYYKKAIETFERAVAIDPANDLAQRSILEAKNNALSVFSADRARQEKIDYATKNLSQALDMIIQYRTPAYMQDMQDVTIMFGETASMNGTPNIAQYEHDERKITVSNSYIYAAPQVIAAYIVHETEHAKDNDGWTSVHEEQDAYEVATKFWIRNSSGVKDPEMDYAADLYKKSPASLRSRVGEIYRLRDPEIAQTSPNHPPKKSSILNIFNRNKNEAASQPLKRYSVIA